MNSAMATQRLRGLGWPVAFNRPYFIGNEIKHLTDLLSQGSVNSDKASTARSIQTLKTTLRVPLALMGSSGTVALELAPQFFSRSDSRQNYGESLSGFLGVPPDLGVE